MKRLQIPTAVLAHEAWLSPSGVASKNFSVRAYTTTIAEIWCQRCMEMGIGTTKNTAKNKKHDEEIECVIHDKHEIACTSASA